MAFSRLGGLCVAALILSPSAAQAGTRIDDPAKFVSALFAQMQAATSNRPYAPPDDIYTPHLAALFALEKKDAGGEVGRLDFDFWSNAQDFILRDVQVSERPVEGAAGREVVTASFRNVGRAEKLCYYFEKLNGQWKLDDARALRGETWTLSLILKYGWDDGK